MSVPPSNRLATLSPLGERLFAVAFCAAGLPILAVACGFIQPPTAALESPRWVVGAAGLMFVAGGFIPLSQRYGPDAWQARLIGAIVLLALASIFNWIAFGPGPRHFASTLSFGGAPLQRDAASETSGRVLFGMVAATLDLMVIAVAARWLRARKS